MFAVQLCSFVSGLIVAREEFLHLPAHGCIYTCSLFLLVPLSVCVFSLPKTPTHADLLYTTTSRLLCALVWRCCHCCPVSLRPAGRVLGRAKQRRSLGASLLLKHSCVIASHTHTHQPVMFGRNHYRVRLYFNSNYFMNERGNCQRGFYYIKLRF